MAITTVTVTPTPVAGNPVNTAPVVTKTHVTGGLTPTVSQARDQVKAQQALNTVVVDKHSAFAQGHKEPEKKVATPKADSTVKNNEKALEGTSEPETAEKEEASDSIKRLNRLEAKTREKDKQLKEAQAKMSELESTVGLKAKDFEELLSTGKSAPIKAIAKLLGIPENEVIEFVAQTVINGGTHPNAGDPKVSELEKKIQTIEQEQVAKEKAQAESATTAAHQAAMNEFLVNVNGVIAPANAEDDKNFELIVLKSSEPATDLRFRNAASEDAWAIAENYYQEYGEILTPEKVAETLEKYYESEAEEEYKTLSRSKKLSAKFGLTPAQAKEVAKEMAKDQKAKKPESPTLSSRKTSSPPRALENKKFKNDKERMEAVVAWGRQQLGQATKKPEFTDPRKR